MAIVVSMVITEVKAILILLEQDSTLVLAVLTLVLVLIALELVLVTLVLVMPTLVLVVPTLVLAEVTLQLIMVTLRLVRVTIVMDGQIILFISWPFVLQVIVNFLFLQSLEDNFPRVTINLIYL